MDLTPLAICSIYKAKAPQKPEAWTRMSVPQLSAVAGRLVAPHRARGQGLHRPEAWTGIQLAQLSLYQPAQLSSPMVPRGLEPRTLRLLAVRSNQLSYETFWWT